MGPIQDDGGTGVTVTPVSPLENCISRVLGGVQMFKLGLQMCTNRITIDRIFFDLFIYFDGIGVTDLHWTGIF